MATLRELKGRIGSVASSEKITGAMKMISSAKMHKAEGALRRLKPYRSTIESIIGNLLTADATFTSPLADPRAVERLTVVVLGSDDGLCGAYNANLAKYLGERIASMRATYGAALRVTIIPVGKKMAKAVARLSGAGTAIRIPDVDSKSEGDKVKDFQASLIESFISKETDAVDVVYMN